MSKKNSRNKCYKTIHDKLFYKGIEEMKNLEEKCEIEFSKIYPFYPNKNRSSLQNIPKVENVKILENQKSEIIMTQKAANEIYNRFKEENQLKEEKLQIIRKFESKYDKETGQKLYKPKINKKIKIPKKKILTKFQNTKLKT